MHYAKYFVPLLSLLLAACSQSAPPPDAATPAAAATATTAASPATAATAAGLPAASASVAKVKLAPIGTCGDQSDVPEAERIVNTAKWTTASEQDNFGYDVYRSESKDGPFVKVTEQPIAGGGTTDETNNYEFRDDTIDPCKDYWYYVESVSTSGQHEKFTPTYEAAAKRRAAPDAK